MTNACKSKILIHGGAWNIPDFLRQKSLDAVEAATRYGQTMLLQNMSAMDIAEKVMVMMENEEVFISGRGSFLTKEGTIECDAMIADDSYNVGSVACLEGVKNPIKAARLVKDHTPHIMLVGQGALNLSKEHGLEIADITHFLAGKELEKYLAWKASGEKYVSRNQSGGPLDLPSDTVGCIIVDNDGNMAVAVSTGGTPGKLRGRVGDSPIWGSGAFAYQGKAAVATGQGEDLARLVISKSAVDLMERKSALDASSEMIEIMEKRVEGKGGLITLDENGTIGVSFCTERMVWACCLDKQTIISGIDRADLSKLKVANA